MKCYEREIASNAEEIVCYAGKTASNGSQIDCYEGQIASYECQIGALQGSWGRAGLLSKWLRRNFLWGSRLWGAARQDYGIFGMNRTGRQAA